MKRKYLIVVDMQHDFVDGSLGSDDAKAIVPAVAEKVKNFNGFIYFTKDTHFTNESDYGPSYEKSLEGKLLPVKHCMLDDADVPTHGHHIVKEVFDALSENPHLAGYKIVLKTTFGSMFLPVDINTDFAMRCEPINIESIEICGLCTDICVISNALILRAMYPNVPIIVDAKCCAGASREGHEAALKVMKSCQIDVVNV